MRIETVYTNTSLRVCTRELGKGSNSNEYTFNNLRSPVCGGKRNSLIEFGTAEIYFPSFRENNGAHDV